MLTERGLRGSYLFFFLFPLTVSQRSWDQPYFGAQPWVIDTSLSPPWQGSPDQFFVSKFSSIVISGLDTEDHAWGALGR